VRIGINALFHARGGSFVYLSELLRGWRRDGTLWKHSVVLFSSSSNLRALEAELDGITVVALQRSDLGTAARLFVEQTELVRAMERERVDVLLCPANTMPLRARIPSVVLLQNAAPFCESVTLSSVGAAQWLRYRVLGCAMRLSVRRAARVIFISEYLRDQFTQRCRLDPTKATVIYGSRRSMPENDQSAAAVLAEHGIRGRFVLSVSHLYPYKNLVELVEGFLLAVREHSIADVQLVLVGAEYFRGYKARIEKVIAGCRAHQGQVILTGGVPSDVVAAMLARCEVFAFSSTCENSPTALIEAIVAGAAIACSRIGVMPEISGDAASYFDPFDPQDIARVLKALLTDADLRRELRRRALARTSRFPESAEVAARTLDVLRAAAVV
jgi:glycosyltransferase involved in cell wall biosynthesis